MTFRITPSCSFRLENLAIQLSLPVCSVHTSNLRTGYSRRAEVTGPPSKLLPLSGSSDAVAAHRPTGLLRSEIAQGDLGVSDISVQRSSATGRHRRRKTTWIKASGSLHCILRLYLKPPKRVASFPIISSFVKTNLRPAPLHNVGAPGAEVRACTQFIARPICRHGNHWQRSDSQAAQ